MTSATLSAATIELAGVPPLTESWSEDEGDLVSQRVMIGAIRFWDVAIVGLSGLALALMYVSEPVMARDTGYGFLIITASTLAVARLRACSLTCR